MRKYLNRVTVALIAFTLGIIVTAAWHHSQRTASHRAPVSYGLSGTTSPIQTAELESYHGSVNPRDVANFINSHPHAELTSLWNRLPIKKSDQMSPFQCEPCSVETMYYDLDDQPGDEALLSVASPKGGLTRFLVFKRVRTINEWSFFDSVDIWDKYEPVHHSLLMSKGKPFLVFRELSANGSGTCLYQNRVFQLSLNYLQEVLSYLGEALIFGELDSLPTVELTSRLESCEVIQVGVRATIKFDFFYSYDNVPLFSKSTLRRFSSNWTPSRIPKASEHEDYDSVSLDFIDSMTGDDILKYNHAELLNLATNGNYAQKKWLRAYLKECDNSSEKRQLFAALRN